MATAFLVVLAAVGIIALMIVSVLLRGWVLSILWGWFAVPIFHLPPLSISQAIAVCLIVSFLTHQFEPSSDDEAKQGMSRASFAILMPLFALAIGWVVKGYLP